MLKTWFKGWLDGILTFRDCLVVLNGFKCSFVALLWPVLGPGL